MSCTGDHGSTSSGPYKMSWSIEDAARKAYHPKPPRRMVCPAYVARAVGWEGSPRWVFRQGMYRLGPFAFPPAILDLPVDDAVAMAKACCGQS